MDTRLGDLLSRALVLDLEVGADGALHKIGALRGGAEFRRPGRFDERTALAELERFAGDAPFVLGHNLLGHDLPVLRARAPGLGLLARPVIDTLFLSPLAFPENPYHRLVKDYKLVSTSVSDPVADCRLAAQVFREQWAELDRRARSGREDDQDRLALYRFCFFGATDLELAPTGGQGIARVFAELGAPLLTVPEVLAVLDRLWTGRVCRTVARAQALRYLGEARLRPPLAYAIAWLQVAGARSVLPPWVRHQFPAVVELLHDLRDVPCGMPDCAWCGETHDPLAQLRRQFGLDAFRPVPSAPGGGSLQAAVVAHGMGDRSLLAILPTGGGKSLCFQLPALTRYLRRGQLTLVISPLQALMKDQVDNLARRTGTAAAAALYGSLTGPERGDVLERVRLGEVAILYVSPEQLRNRSLRRVLEAREIGAWVFDEAHCLSKWGHDFRPDYIYAARFIRELAEVQGVPVPPVACFTATAKPDVIAEILGHFNNELGLTLKRFEGGVERDNLSFEIRLARPQEKEAQLQGLLKEHLGGPGVRDGAGDAAAIVYAAKRKGTEELADCLARQGWAVAAFHAGLPAPEKRRIQDAFVAGQLQVICATNAFGMGVDKEDVRLVVHAEIPGSLENYLQEAGRAGRDQAPAACVLLYCEQDIEDQFRLAARSALTRADIAEILRGLRRARRDGEDCVVLTAGELLRDADLRIGFDAAENDADTRVRTAIAWLERAGLVERNENRTRVFDGRPAVPDLDTARRRIDGLDISAERRARWLAVLEALLECDPDEGLSTDDLAMLPVFRAAEGRPNERAAIWDRGATAGQRVLRTLHDMAEARLLQRGPQLSAFVRYKVRSPSAKILAQVCGVEQAMLEVLREEAPDADDGGWYPLSLRRLNQHLRDDKVDSNPELLRTLLASLARDGQGLAASRGSLELRQVERDHYRMRLHRDWAKLAETALRRQAVAEVVLATLIAKIPDGEPPNGERLVGFGTDELTAALAKRQGQVGHLTDPLAAVERGLLFLHEHGAISLQSGVAVFRQAMTIRIPPEAKGRYYTKGHFAPLAQHYAERIFQIHVMEAYARLGLERITRAIELVIAYFALDHRSFANKYFADRREMLERATTAESFRRIVDALDNPEQIAIVAAEPEANRLVLAGPGSGKTRVIVHRCAYLLRVRRVDPRSILILCYNRSAALELRRRLAALVDADARGVTIQTYHGFAMRLTGTSFAERAQQGQGGDDGFAGLIEAALDLLEGRADWPGIEADGLRERLLAGYRHILVDEYQDIDAQQYRLVAAIAGRTLAEDADAARLTLLAVGDDDQNIYAFRGASIEFIRRFEADYQARTHHLIENYRSSAHICAAAHALIAHNRERMKTGQRIGVDRRRRADPPGGRWSDLDPHGRGRVEVLEVADPGRQAAAFVERLRRLKSLGGSAWADFAVLAFRRRALQPIRAACEAAGVTVAWRDDLPPLSRVREIARFLDRLADLGHGEIAVAELRCWLPAAESPWRAILVDLIDDWREEAGDAPSAASRCLEFCYESLGELRNDRRLGDGVLFSTLHGAKGLEFPHVLIADDRLPARAQTDAEEWRRLYYVGMTRARETLALGCLPGGSGPRSEAIAGDWLLRTSVAIEPPPEEVLRRRYQLLTPADIDLGYAGRKAPDDPIHARLAAVVTGDRLKVVARDGALLLRDEQGAAIARLSRKATDEWRARLERIEAVRVVAMMRRRRDDGEGDFRTACRSPQWEYPLVELVWRSDDGDRSED
ncbi:RecQ family ATP-dependent DNA helicase [Thioflavicoccus mobilis]|uniref:RecQ family ATP-dependent DNA helicase n=1 Tax=Thioflavicoccus mobilis TaxID=80679 RepID=UPI00031324BC|nr:RecQ family ATP-dependent DNA helicase [Thioflavicoccus mobilis]